jgi:hypothetical protein
MKQKAEKFLNTALGGNMNLATLKPLALIEIMTAFAEIEVAAINYTRCCTELFCLDNTDADGLTLHKRYKFINEDETNSLIIDDYGGNKAYLSNRFVKVIK